MKVNQIIKVPEIEKLFPKPRNYDEIKADIAQRGIQIPLIINLADSKLVCGYTRYKIAQELHIDDVPVSFPMVFANLNEMKRYAIKDNDLRRHFSDLERYEYVVKPWLEIEREEAKERQGTRTDLQHLTQNASEVKRADDLVGAQVGWSGDKVQRMKKISESAAPEVKEKLNVNELTQQAALEIAKLEDYNDQREIIEKYADTKDIEKAVRRIISTAKQVEIVETPTLPEGKYRCIVIDPPWPMNKIEREVRPNQSKPLDYPTMTIEEIRALELPTNPDGCHLYLWTTHKFLPGALEIIEAWGFKYQCVLTWIKNIGFTPFSWMYSTELVLFGRMGNLDLLQNGLRIDFSGKVREHSRKPDEFYELVKQASPEPRIDMFSREVRNGFNQWGAETDYFKPVEQG